MYDMPIIHLELQSIKREVSMMLQDKGNELSALVAKTIEKELTSDWIADRVTHAVQTCIANAIDDIAKNDDLKAHLTKRFVNELIKRSE